MRPSQMLQSLVGVATIGAIIFFFFFNSGDVATVRNMADQVLNPEQASDQVSPQSDPAAMQTVLLQRSQSEIIIGTMNIQTFGLKKLKNQEVMATLVQIARQFDCLAIQEIRSKHDQTLLRQFVEMINANGSRYSYFLSPLMGNSNQTFQYGLIFDTARIEPTGTAFVVPDPRNLLHREPMVTGLRTRTANPAQAFSFALVNVHIDPDQTRAELDVLYEIVQWLRIYMPGEDDLIVLGDFNEPPHKYGNMWQIPTLRAAISDGIATNTLRNAAYDNILFDGERTREFTGKSGVLDIQQAFGLTLEQARAVSDHLPVWAAFSAGEMPTVQHANQAVPVGR